jgi:hypothetical protein
MPSQIYTPKIQVPTSVSKDWIVSEKNARPMSLLIQLRQRAYVLPYSRFVYAHGDDSQAQLWFATHIVTVEGHQLLKLLEDLAAERIQKMIEPAENEAKFGVRGPNAAPYGGPAITAITVEEVVEEEE